MTDKRDFIFGAVFGEAIGDALGHPIEFKKTHKVVDLPSSDPSENKFTDDTQMFCAIGEALIEAPPHVDEEAFMGAVASRFDQWRKKPLGGSHRAPGGNCMDAVRKLGAGVHWSVAGGLDFKGNGSAMRSGIVGAFYWKNPEYAFRIGALTSACTHNNLEALLGSGMVAYLVADSILRGIWAESIADGLILCADFPRVLPFYPSRVALGTKFDQQNPWYAISHFGAAFALGAGLLPVRDCMLKLMDRENLVTDGAVVPAVAEAIFFNTRCKGFEEAALTAVNNSDDTDTIGAITGTIAGASWGASSIPERWLQNIELADYLSDLAERITAASNSYVAEQQEAETAAGDMDFDELFSGEDPANEGEEITF